MKKIKYILISLFVVIFINIGNVYAASTDFEYYQVIDLCDTDALKIFQIVGYVIVVIKILVPIIIIGRAILELTKVVLTGEEKDMSFAFQTLLKRIVAGVIIFFIPTLLNLLLSIVDNASETNDGFSTCNVCLFEPNSSECEKALP